MRASSDQHKRNQSVCRALCCSSRLSTVSSSSSSLEGSESSRSGPHASVSSLSHRMVQEKLNQMIREDQEAVHREKRRARRRHGSEGTKFVVIVAMEKSSCDPREDFRDSMMEMILANRMKDPKELRDLLNYYLSMNSEECHSIILGVFHEARIQAQRVQKLRHYRKKSMLIY